MIITRLLGCGADANGGIIRDGCNETLVLLVDHDITIPFLDRTLHSGARVFTLLPTCLLPACPGAVPDLTIFIDDHIAAAHGADLQLDRELVAIDDVHLAEDLLEEDVAELRDERVVVLDETLFGRREGEGVLHHRFVRAVVDLDHVLSIP